MSQYNNDSLEVWEPNQTTQRHLALTGGDLTDHSFVGVPITLTKKNCGVSQQDTARMV